MLRDNSVSIRIAAISHIMMITDLQFTTDARKRPGGSHGENDRRKSSNNHHDEDVGAKPLSGLNRVGSHHPKGLGFRKQIRKSCHVRLPYDQPLMRVPATTPSNGPCDTK